MTARQRAEAVVDKIPQHLVDEVDLVVGIDLVVGWVEAEIRSAVSEEREACAAACDERAARWRKDGEGLGPYEQSVAAKVCADAIRKRLAP